MTKLRNFLIIDISILRTTIIGKEYGLISEMQVNPISIYNKTTCMMSQSNFLKKSMDNMVCIHKVIK
jgi:hypothetical protein